MIIAYYYVSTHDAVSQIVVQKTAKEKIIILAKGMIPLSVMIIIVGGIMTGVMTATESAAVASVYVVFVGFFIYRKMTWSILIDTAVETALAGNCHMA